MLFAMLRIIAGEFRSRRLASPPDEAVSRPYPERVKEAVFNMLREWFDEGGNVLDLFAGVGTMGLEAVSRGALNVVLVEQSRPIFRLMEQNIAALGCVDRAKAVCGDALSETTLLRAPTPVDLVFLDPPYPMMVEERTRRRILDQMSRLRRIMAKPGLLILRSPRGPDEMDLAVEGLIGPEARRYARDMWVLVYEPQPPQPPEPPEPAEPTVRPSESGETEPQTPGDA
jgi:16S rRNA (guanine966-N2)-methyltransferase